MRRPDVFKDPIGRHRATNKSGAAYTARKTTNAAAWRAAACVVISNMIAGELACPRTMRGRRF
jgi:hypothetical protein